MADQETAPALVGGPGIETPDQPEEAAPNVELVTVTISGRTVQVTPEVAEAIQADSLKRTQDFGRQGEEMRRLRAEVETIAARQQQPQPQTPARDPDLDFYESPHATLEKRDARLRQEIMQEVSQAYRMEQERQVWWGIFYDDNKGLKGQDALVQAALQQEWNNIKDLPGPEARKLLAKAAYGIARIEVPPDGTRTVLSNTPARTERPSTPRSPAPSQPTHPANELGSVVDFLTKRKAARQKK